MCRQGECFFDPCGYIECPPGESCVVDDNGDAQCVADWTPDMMDDEEPIEDDPEMAGEMSPADDSEIDMVAGEESPEISLDGDTPSEMDDDRRGSSVEGCHQRSNSPINLGLILYLVFLGWRRRTLQHSERM